MSSLSRDRAPGTWRIIFVDAEGQRKTIRLGKLPRRAAEGVQRHVDILLGCRVAGQPLPRDTALWLEEIGYELREKLARAGLVEGKRRLTVGEFLDQWIEQKKREGAKPATIASIQVGMRYFRELFGEKPLDSITVQDALAYRDYLAAQGLAKATVARRLQHARHAFADAVRLQLIPLNPFLSIKASAGDISRRRVYVPAETVFHVLEHCPNAYWRLLIALARFAGLRIPSEALSLKWEYVNWADRRLTVYSPKTEGRGKPFRVIPINDAFLPYLEEVWELAKPGDEYIFPEEWRKRAQGPNGWININLRTQFERILHRAGVEPWPKPFQNLRSSCESDWAEEFPLTIVAKWLGHTPSIALRHYVDPTDESFERGMKWTPKTQRLRAQKRARCAQNAAQQEHSGKRTDMNSET